jgi:hypothetical protein
MLEFLAGDGGTSERKLRLFACACVRQQWGRLSNPALVAGRSFAQAQRAVEVAERFADGHVTRARLDREYRSALGSMEAIGTATDAMMPAEVTIEVLEDVRLLDAAAMCAAEDIVNGASLAAQFVAGTFLGAGQDNETRRRIREQSSLLRCIFGNPYRSPSLKNARFPSAAIKLAATIYKARSFQRLPELAAVLENAGYTDAELVGHLRSQNLHARGCWALDVVLRKVEHKSI